MEAYSWLPVCSHSMNQLQLLQQYIFAVRIIHAGTVIQESYESHADNTNEDKYKIHKTD